MLNLVEVIKQLHKQGLNLVPSVTGKSYVVYRGKEQITAPLATENLEKNDLAQLYYLEEGFKFKRIIELHSYIPEHMLEVVKESLKNKNIFVKIEYVCKSEEGTAFSTKEFKIIPLFELSKLNKQLYLYLYSHQNDFKKLDKMNNGDFIKYYGNLKNKYNGEIYENRK